MKPREKILVTGATGRLGQHLVKKLLDKGFGLRLQARDKTRCRELFGERCEVIQLDLAKAHVNEVFEACHGCGQVIHLAALLNGSEKQLMQNNFEATKKLVAAARKAGAKRFVYCSSTAVYGNPAGIASEDSLKKPVNAYGRSKLLAEEVVKAGGVPWIIIRPSVIYGPGFQTGFREIVQLMEKGLMPLIGSGKNRLAFVHVDDVVNAFVLALEKKWIENEDYNISGPPVTQERCLRMVAEALGVKPRVVRVPKPVAYAAAGAMELFSRAGGKRVPWLDFARVLAEDRVFSTTKAERVLGWRPRAVFAKEAALVVTLLSGPGPARVR